jgi:hypothetical protein
MIIAQSADRWNILKKLKLQKRKQRVPNYALLSNFVEIVFRYEYRNGQKRIGMR